MRKKISRKNFADILYDMDVRNGVEVGVWEGAFSELLLQRTGVDVLRCVDRWDGCGMSRLYDAEAIYNTAMKRLKPYGNRVKILRGESILIANQICNQSLDFAYLDASHDYESVKRDIAAWLPKVRNGGVISGHDYKNLPRTNKFVKKAVDEIFGAKVKLIGSHPPNWWVIKEDASDCGFAFQS